MKRIRSCGNLWTDRTVLHLHAEGEEYKEEERSEVLWWTWGTNLVLKYRCNIIVTKPQNTWTPHRTWSVERLRWQGFVFRQYWGVFSRHHCVSAVSKYHSFFYPVTSVSQMLVHKDDDVVPGSTKVKNLWSHTLTLTPPHVLVVRCLIQRSCNFNLNVLNRQLVYTTWGPSSVRIWT